jgi:hypothetical protein
MENMKTSSLALALSLISSPCFGGMKQGEIQKAPFSLKIDQETYLTDTKGVLNPKMILGLIPSNSVKIYLTDGTVLNGLIKETENHNNEIYKVFGEVTNKENVGFGFVLTKEGIFAGAVVFRNTDETHTVQYSEELKAFILVKSLGKKITPSFFRK